MNATIRCKITLGVVAIFLLVGCAGIGPKTIPRDRFDYAEAISKSWKRQMLLNMVKIRYADVPVFVDVASVISQYAVEGQIDLRASWNNTPIIGDTQSVGGSGKYTDRPTITYSPLIGEKFARSLTKPLPPPAIFFLIQAGYPVDFVFRTCVQAINNIYNRSGAQHTSREADPEFYRLLSILMKMQKSGAVGMRIHEGEDKSEGTVFIIRKKHLTPEIAAEISTVKRLLGLNPDLQEFRIVYGSTPKDDTEIAVLSRSMLEIIVEMASYVDVPELHLTEGRSYPTVVDQMDVSKEFGPLLEVHSDKGKPADDFVAVRYHDHWFWIDDRDLASKRNFSFMLLLFAFTEKEGALAPVVTIPAG